MKIKTNLYASLRFLFALLAMICFVQIAPTYADPPASSSSPPVANSATELKPACEPGKNGVSACPLFTNKKCTTAARQDDALMGSSNVLHNILRAINTILSNISQMFYDGALPKLSAFITGMLILYIVSYGFLVMFQIVPLAYAEVFTRVLKIGIVIFLLKDWATFYEYLGKPVLDTLDLLVKAFINISIKNTLPAFTGTQALDAAGKTLANVTSNAGIADVKKSEEVIMALLQSPFAWVLNTRYFIMIYSIFFSGYLGPIFSIFLILTLWTLLKVIIAGFFNYLRARVVIYFLFGIAPIFIIFMLFEETRRKLLQGWINQVVSIAIQPVIYFAFVGFFFLLINTTMQHIVLANFEACEVLVDDVSNTSMEMMRPSQRNPLTNQMEPYSGGWGSELPLDKMSVILVWLLVELAWRFTKYVEQIGADISQGSIDIVVKMTSKARDVSNFIQSLRSPPV